jgi:hypothetical protein
MIKTYQFRDVTLVATGEKRCPEIGEYYLGTLINRACKALPGLPHSEEKPILIPSKTYTYNGIKLQVSGEYRLPKRGEYFFDSNYKYEEEDIKIAPFDFQSCKCVILKPVEVPVVPVAVYEGVDKEFLDRLTTLIKLYENTCAVTVFCNLGITGPNNPSQLFTFDGEEFIKDN